jgi:hypothetical protein
VALNPNHPGIIADQAEALIYSSRPDLALQKIETAIALHPLSPDSYFWIASAASYMLGSFEAALGYIDRMADARLADRISAASWAMLGDKERAGFFGCPWCRSRSNGNTTCIARGCAERASGRAVQIRPGRSS